MWISQWRNFVLIVVLNWIVVADKTSAFSFAASKIKSLGGSENVRENYENDYWSYSEIFFWGFCQQNVLANKNRLFKEVCFYSKMKACIVL